MKSTLRIVVGLVGLFNLFIGLNFLFAPARMAHEFALSPLGVQGMATMRADFPAFFLTGAVFSLFGAWRADAKPLLVPLMLLSAAICGRFVSIALDGTASTTFPPIIAEAVMIGLLSIAYRSFAPAR
jgi:Domain of unknown function (DUF4345)